MLTDHAAVVLLPQFPSVSPWVYVACRMIGRLAFPLFALGVAEGAVHTKSPKKYLLRMFLFALAAQIPFMLMTGTEHASRSITLFGQSIGINFEFSVMVTLFLGLSICLALREKKYFGAALAIMAAYAAELSVGMDWGIKGVLFIVALYLAKEKKWQRLLVMLVFAGIFYFAPIKSALYDIIKKGTFTMRSGLLYYFAMSFAAVLALFYNGNQGRKMGVWCYIFYPVHMLLLWVIWLLIKLGGAA